MTARIGKRVVDGLAATGREYFLWDGDLTGFGVRVRASGVKSYVYRYRAGAGRGAPVRRLTLGSVGKISPDQARELARIAAGDVAHGRDPAGERADERSATTVAALVALFMSEHGEAKLKPRTRENYETVLRLKVVPEIGALRASKVSRADVAKLHLKWRETPQQANNAVRVLSAMYGFAAGRGLVPEGFNPASRIGRYRSQERERYLSSEELERLGVAIRLGETEGLPWDTDESAPGAKHLPKKVENRRVKLTPHAAGAVRLLIFTGCRLREILKLEWAHVDVERGLLNLADSKTGRKTVILNAPALRVLNELPRVGGFVIAGDDPRQHRHDLKRPWAAVIRHAGLQGLRIHDLRHNFASFGAGGGLGLPIIGKLLGHSQPATTARYAHLDIDPLRRASERIGAKIAAALDGGDGGGVRGRDR